jgi:hypothetical protein
MIFKNWYLWKGVSNWLLSNEDTKELSEFKDTDQAINWLYLNGHKEAARHFNKEITRC